MPIPLDRTLRWIAPVVLCAGLRAAGYQDPQGRFALQVPDGWSTAPLNGDAVQFASGNCYLTVMVFAGADPQTLMQGIARQTGSQWRRFAEVRRDSLDLGGRPGKAWTFEGVNPQGREAQLRLLGSADGPRTVLMMISAAKTELQAKAPDLERMRASFRFQGRAQAPAPAPAPASAPAAAQAAARIPPPAAPAPAAGPGIYRMRPHVVIDQRGFEKPMPALRLLLPADWQFQGRVEYSQTIGCHADLVQVVFQARSADGRLQLELFPNHHWQWATDPNLVQMLQANARQAAAYGRHECDIARPLGAADYLRQQVLPKARPGAQVLETEPLPDLARNMNAQVQEQQRLAARQGLQVRAQVDAARVRVAYSRQGADVEEWLACVTVAASVPAPTFNRTTGRMGQTLSTQCAAFLVFGMSAPRGELAGHERLFDMILATVRADPEWEGRVLQAIGNLNAADSKGAMDRAAIARQTGQAIAESSKKGFEERSRRQDRSFAQFDEYIRGVQTYRNPATGEQVQLSNQYGRAWCNGNDEYVLSDQPGFNPNQALRGNWTELQPVH